MTLDQERKARYAIQQKLLFILSGPKGDLDTLTFTNLNMQVVLSIQHLL